MGSKREDDKNMLEESELQRKGGPSHGDSNFTDEELSAVNENKLIRRIDYRLVPWLALLYLLSFLDRTNIGNANLFGLARDINLTQQEYSTCLAIFFAFYVLFEVPSNAVMKAWRPSLWLPIIMVAWGIVITLTGIVQNFGGLFAARVFLGITEAGLFPGVSFFLTCWYKRYEVNFRIALFFSAATAAGAFGGLLARLINLMDGVGGLQGWRWIFILEGILTVIIAAASFWMLYDYPDTASFMTPVEREYIKRRLHEDTDGLSTKFDKKFILQALLDWRVWAFSFMYIGSLMPVYSFSLFSPTLVANLGYTATTAQLLSVPPYVLAAISTISAGFLSDRAQKRGIFSIGYACVGIIGFIFLIVSPPNLSGLGYAGLFLGAAGIYPLIPLQVSWAGNNFGGATNRAVGMALVISIGNAGGIISSFIYKRADRPRYFLGHAVVIGFITMSATISALMLIYFKRENAKRDRIDAARGPYTEAEYKEFEDMGSDAPYFRYVL